MFACIFLAIAYFEDKYDVETNWLLSSGLNEKSWQEKYTYAIYFSVTTMTSVGYGDINATTRYEAFFLFMAMFVTAGVFSYTFNCIGVIVD